jgi:lysozyme family protein
MRNNYDQAFEFVVGHEGGLTLDRRDRGNWTSGRVGTGELKGTKYGVSAMSYPDLDIKNLTVAQAKEIYKSDYWDRIRADELPDGIDYMAFDIAVNHGPKDAVVWLQVSSGAQADGKIGPATMAAIKKRDPLRLLEEIATLRQLDYSGLKTWGVHGKGWTRRNMSVLLKATIMAGALDQSKAEPEETVLGGWFRRV